MLDYAAAAASDRQLRLFAAACRRVLASPVCRGWWIEKLLPLIEILEHSAKGLVSQEEWARNLQCVLALRAELSEDHGMNNLPASFCAVYCAIDNDPGDAPKWSAVNANIALSQFPTKPERHEATGSEEARFQAELLREILGNPFH